MAFNYELSSTDSDVLRISKLRLKLGDTLRDSGVLPDGRNFSDEELLILFEEEGDHPQRAQAAAYEALASAWSAFAGRDTAGPLSTEFRQAKSYGEMASRFRKEYGYNNLENAFSVAVTPPS